MLDQASEAVLAMKKKEMHEHDTCMGLNLVHNNMLCPFNDYCYVTT